MILHEPKPMTTEELTQVIFALSDAFCLPVEQ